MAASDGQKLSPEDQEACFEAVMHSDIAGMQAKGLLDWGHYFLGNVLHAYSCIKQLRQPCLFPKCVLYFRWIQEHLNQSLPRHLNCTAEAPECVCKLFVALFSHLLKCQAGSSCALCNFDMSAYRIPPGFVEALRKSCTQGAQQRSRAVSQPAHLAVPQAFMMPAPLFPPFGAVPNPYLDPTAAAAAAAMAAGYYQPQYMYPAPPVAMGMPMPMAAAPLTPVSPSMSPVGPMQAVMMDVRRRPHSNSAPVPYQPPPGNPG